jgi:nucleoside transporter
VAWAEAGRGAAGAKWIRVRLWLAFFFIAMSPGCWIPSLTNIMGLAGMAVWVPLAFAVGPLAGILSPLWAGALADNRIAGEKLLGWITLGGTFTLWLTFYSVERGWPAWVFLTLLAINSLISAPMWSLMTTVALANLPDPERQFPQVRLGGTLGWIAGGLMVSFALHADASPVAGYAASAVRVLAGLMCLALPTTPPRGNSRTWRTLFGFDALRLLKQRDHAVFFLTTGLFSMPLMALFMYTPEQLRHFGDQGATGTMVLGQVSEILAMLVIGMVMVRARVKTILLLALGLSAFRFALCGVSELWGGRPLLMAGLLMHGVCYTFYFITAQIFLDRRVDPGVRGQAQALMSLVAAGIGSLAGSFMVGAVHRVTVGAGLPYGWLWFWGSLATMIAAIGVIFAVFYKGAAAADAVPSVAAGAPVPLENP